MVFSVPQLHRDLPATVGLIPGSVSASFAPVADVAAGPTQHQLAALSGIAAANGVNISQGILDWALLKSAVRLAPQGQAPAITSSRPWPHQYKTWTQTVRREPYEQFVWDHHGSILTLISFLGGNFRRAHVTHISLLHKLFDTSLDVPASTLVLGFWGAFSHDAFSHDVFMAPRLLAGCLQASVGCQVSPDTVVLDILSHPEHTSKSWNTCLRV